jgi:hypothetical protein
MFTYSKDTLCKGCYSINVIDNEDFKVDTVPTVLDPR